MTAINQNTVPAQRFRNLRIMQGIPDHDHFPVRLRILLQPGPGSAQLLLGIDIGYSDQIAEPFRTAALFCLHAQMILPGSGQNQRRHTLFPQLPDPRLSVRKQPAAHCPFMIPAHIFLR